VTLFDDQLPDTGAGGAEADDAIDAATPLPERLRPRTLEEVVGQDEVVGPDGFLSRAIQRDRVASLIFWGPPGSGKTTLARIMARETRARFVPFSAVTSGIKEVKALMAEARKLRRAGQRTLVFVDEIHRFNRAQQDAFLPYVEAGDIVLVGATTENPSFEVNSALLSRCRVVVLEQLSPEDLKGLMRRALADAERGLGELGVEIDEEALDSLAQLASGDARRALNLLELAATDVVETAQEAGGEDGEAGGVASAPRIGAEEVRRVAQRKVVVYDKSGEEHYNVISALHKSLRDSDADAALYWLARQLDAGEDPLYIARRLVRFASEDVGLADPGALPQCLAAWDAYHRLGSPEGELAIAQAVLYLALAPKSNAAYVGYKKARRTVQERPADPVPKVIRNAPTKLMKDTGYGEGYVYAHDTEEGTGGLDCLPDALSGTRFYQPTGRGFEQELGRRLDHFRKLRADVKRKRQGEEAGTDRGRGGSEEG